MQALNGLTVDGDIDHVGLFVVVVVGALAGAKEIGHVEFFPSDGLAGFEDAVVLVSGAEPLSDVQHDVAQNPLPHEADEAPSWKVHQVSDGRDFRWIGPKQSREAVDLDHAETTCRHVDLSALDAIRRPGAQKSGIPALKKAQTLIQVQRDARGVIVGD